jgi:hypothetical protein
MADETPKPEDPEKRKTCIVESEADMTPLMRAFMEGLRNSKPGEDPDSPVQPKPYLIKK